MVVPWSEIPAWKWAKVGKPIAAHEFCKRLISLKFRSQVLLHQFRIPLLQAFFLEL